MPTVSVELVSYAGVSVYIDDVSLVPEPLRSDTSCTDTRVHAHPGSVTVSWATPPGEVDTVQVRWGNRSHPSTVQEGLLLANVPAVPGTTQEVTVPVDWTQQTPGAFFSVFAVNDGEIAPPDLASIRIDRSAPSAPNVQVTIEPDLAVTASWTSLDPESAVEQYRYAVGTSAGAADVVDWTVTPELSVSLPGLPSGARLHVSVQAQNVFGYWSPVGSAVFQLTDTISEAVGLPDGVTVKVSGVVTAVFPDCVYVQQPGRERGVRVRGAPVCDEGDELTICGTLTTDCGERVLVGR